MQIPNLSNYTEKCPVRIWKRYIPLLIARSFNFQQLFFYDIFFCATRNFTIYRSSKYKVIPAWSVTNRAPPSSKVWHRCRSKPPNCRFARAARVICAQPGTVVCSKTPLSLVVCRSGWGVVCGSVRYMLIQK